MPRVSVLDASFLPRHRVVARFDIKIRKDD